MFDLPRFIDRDSAGRRLGAALRQYAHDPDLIVLALPRGARRDAAVVRIRRL
jgi:predicted phosphoribosyltransferase